MALHRIVVHEGTESEDDTFGSILEPRYKYEVLTPIFKNGQTYSIGDTIELTKGTALGFLELNEIKEIER